MELPDGIGLWRNSYDSSTLFVLLIFIASKFFLSKIPNRIAFACPSHLDGCSFVSTDFRWCAPSKCVFILMTTTFLHRFSQSFLYRAAKMKYAFTQLGFVSMPLVIGCSTSSSSNESLAQPQSSWCKVMSEKLKINVRLECSLYKCLRRYC